MFSWHVFPKPQAINYSVTREKAPVYTMGSPDARAYSRNKRGIAGSLIWINFDRHALLNLIQQCAGTFVANVDEIRPQYTHVADGGSIFQSSITRGAGSNLAVGATIDQFDNAIINSASQTKQLATAWYSDQVLPFDITLSGANEYGAMCAAKIYGVEILNEGWGISIDDAVSEMQATFVARVVEPMSAVASPFLFKTRSFRPAAATRTSRVRGRDGLHSCRTRNKTHPLLPPSVVAAQPIVIPLSMTEPFPRVLSLLSILVHTHRSGSDHFQRSGRGKRNPYVVLILLD